jgi:HK97 gp10 family phage protein
MAKYRIDLSGDRVLAAKLHRLTDAEAKKAILGACRESIKVIQAEARTLAPSKTGAMRRSIKVRSIARSRKRVGVRVTTSASDNMYGGKTFYGAFQEFGWKTGSRKGTANRKQIPGKNFMKQAAGAKKGSALEIFKAKIDDYIRKVLKK